jgi:hypothetical protein
MTASLPSRPRKPRPRHGTQAQQIEALDRGLTEMGVQNARLASRLEAAEREITEAAIIAAVARKRAADANRKADSLADALRAVTERERGRTEPDTGSLLDCRNFPGPCHPESMDGELPGADEEWLDHLCGELWPEGEYTDIVRRDGPGGTP